MEVKKKQSVKNKLSDVLHSIKWAHISTHYFGKSRSWLSQSLNGYDRKGSENDFSQEEVKILKKALFDLSERIRKAAEGL